MSNKNKFTIYILIGLMIFGVIGLVFYYTVYSAEIDFAVIPGNVRIFINNKKISNSKTRLKPGKYKIKAEADGFDMLEKEIEVKAGKNKESFYLTSKGDYYEKNKTMRDLAEKIDQDEVDEHAEKLLAKHPILKILPMKVTPDDFEISSKIENNDVILVVSRCEKMNEAKEYIDAFGFDPNKYKMVCEK